MIAHTATLLAQLSLLGAWLLGIGGMSESHGWERGESFRFLRSSLSPAAACQGCSAHLCAVPLKLRQL